MARPDDPKRLARAGLWAALVLCFFGLFVRAAVWTHSVVGGLLGSVPVLALGIGLSIWSRRRVAQQVQASRHSGRLSVPMCLDFWCLPGDWPTLARKTLPFRGYRARFLPVRITAIDGRLEIDKRSSFWQGWAPFHAQVSTAEITGVSVGPPCTGLMGSSITIALRSGEEVRGDVSVGREHAEELAAQLRMLMGGWPAGASSGIRVTSPPP